VARRAVQRTQPRALLMRDLRDRIERVSLTDFTVLIDGGIAGRK
jgi:DNA-binding NtrC family response regulator